MYDLIYRLELNISGQRLNLRRMFPVGEERLRADPRLWAACSLIQQKFPNIVAPYIGQRSIHTSRRAILSEFVTLCHEISQHSGLTISVEGFG